MRGAMCIAFFCIARCRPERFVVLKHQWYLGNNTSLDPDLIHDDLILDTDWYLYLTIHVMWQGSWVPMIFENHQSIYFWPLKHTIRNHLKLHYSQSELSFFVVASWLDWITLIELNLWIINYLWIRTGQKKASLWTTLKKIW